MGDMRPYAFPLGAHLGDLDRQESILSDDTELPDLIIDELSDSMALYYRKLKSMGRNICGGCREFIDIVEE